jgi:hypothetical protein
MDGKRGLLATFVEFLNAIANRTINPFGNPFLRAPPYIPMISP